MGTSVSLVGNAGVVVVPMCCTHTPRVFLCSKQVWCRCHEELRPEHEEFTEAVWSILVRSIHQPRPGGTLCTFWVPGLQTGDRSGAFSCELIVWLVWIFRLL